MEILAGIDNSAIYRLKRTWPLVSDKRNKLYDRLKAQASSSQAYKAQREALHACKPPCVPYLGMYLTDITFIEDGNKEFVEHEGHKLVNFRKCRLLAAVLKEIQIYQQTPYHLTPITYMQMYLMTEKPPDNEALFQLSLKVEPRGDIDAPLPPHPCPTDEHGRDIVVEYDTDDPVSLLCFVLFFAVCVHTVLNSGRRMKMATTTAAVRPTTMRPMRARRRRAAPTAARSARPAPQSA